MERAMGIEQIQTVKTRRYCPLFQFNWSQMDQVSVELVRAVGIENSPTLLSPET
jgi:hypothetical protein